MNEKYLEVMHEKSKLFKMRQISDKIAYDIMLWLNYSTCNESSLERLAKSSMDEYVLTKEEWQECIKEAVYILKSKYNTEVVSENPIDFR